MHLVIDAANVVGSRPDGWWRDRAGANARLLERLATLPGREVAVDQTRHTVECVSAVVEGAARAVRAPAGSPVEVVAAPADGDATLADVVAGLQAAGTTVVLVTADRGLRARVAPVPCVGPSWLHALC